MENAYVCQSCGMPMEKGNDVFGKNADGSINELYCQYCYVDGGFNNPNETMEQMIETCIPFMVESGMDADYAKKTLEETLPTLKRWQ